MHQLPAALALPVGSDWPADLSTTLDWPPSVNYTWSQFVMPPSLEKIQARYATHGWEGFWKWLRTETKVRGRKDDKVKVYTEAVAWQLKNTRVRFEEADIAVRLIFHPPTARKPDMDNRLKQIFDAIQWGGMVGNDNQVAACLFMRGEPCLGGSVEVLIWRL